MTESGPKLSVLVPVYNEERTVREVLRRVLSLGPILKEVVVVNDGSREGTAKVLEGIARSEPLVRVFSLERNQGKTAAIRHALEQSTGEILHSRRRFGI